MTSTELIDLVLTGQHPKLRERCFVDRIVSVLEDTFGAFDAKVWRGGAAPPQAAKKILARFLRSDKKLRAGDSAISYTG